MRKENFNKLIGNIEIKIEKRGNYIKIGPLISINQEWIYIGELIRGDGHITPNFWNITFVNNNWFLIKYVENFFKSIGIKSNQISIIRRNDANFLIIRSSVLAHLFNKILNIPTGKKSELNMPSFIILNEKMGIAAVRGAFDAEGSVTSKGSRRISITSNSKNWLIQLKQILEKLRIESRIFEDKSKDGKQIYRLFISHRSNLKKFLKIINPLHTKRKEKLKERLADYKRNPQKMFHKKILLSVKDGYCRKRDISNKIKQSLITTGNNINWLKKKGYIVPYEKIHTNKGSFYNYKITEKGESYLKDSLSFFD